MVATIMFGSFIRGQSRRTIVEHFASNFGLLLLAIVGQVNRGFELALEQVQFARHVDVIELLGGEADVVKIDLDFIVFVLTSSEVALAFVV